MHRLSIVVVALSLLGCGRTSFNEFGTLADEGSEGNTDTSQTAGTDTNSDTSAVSDLPPDEPMTTSTSGTSTSTTGDGDGDPDTTTTSTTGDGDGDPGTTGTTEESGGPECGNNMVEIGEQCDGPDLDGEDCESLGYDSGLLGCDPVICVYDASACVTDMGGGGTTG